MASEIEICELYANKRKKAFCCLKIFKIWAHG